MNPTPASTLRESEAAPVVDVVASDISCLTCGYNLRGLLAGGRCPECAALVSDSVRGDLLRFSDPRWLSRVVLGLRIAYWSVAAIVLLVILLMVAAVVSVGALSGSSGGAASRVLSALAVVLGALGLLLPVAYPLGWWFATAPEGHEDDQRRRRRLALRSTAVVILPVAGLWKSPVATWVRPDLAPAVIEMVTLGCFVLWWWHLGLIAHEFQARFRRCRLDDLKRHRRAEKAIARTRSMALWFPALLLAAHFGVGIPFAILIARGAADPLPPQLGVTLGQGVGNIWMTLLWISVVSTGAYALAAVKHERSIQWTD